VRGGTHCEASISWERPMKNLSTTIATYNDEAVAEKDWAAVESAARAGSIDLADAALIRRAPDESVVTLHRQSHHGWGKGAVAGAVVGVVFPPAIIAGAVAGAAGGGLVARMNRSLSRADIKDLGEVMDLGEIAMVVLTQEGSVKVLVDLLEGAEKTVTRSSATAEEVQEVLNSETYGPQ
jgi:uncharacterized membrane protein